MREGEKGYETAKKWMDIFNAASIEAAKVGTKKDETKVQDGGGVDPWSQVKFGNTTKSGDDDDGDSKKDDGDSKQDDKKKDDKTGKKGKAVVIPNPLRVDDEEEGGTKSKGKGKGKSKGKGKGNGGKKGKGKGK